MVEWPLALASLVDVAVGAIFALVGAYVASRASATDARPARLAFATWWYGIAGATAVAGLSIDGGALGLVASVVGAGRLPAPFLLAVVLAWTLLVTVGLWGLLAHLVFIFRGRLVARELAAVYAILFAGFTVVTFAERPYGLADNVWGVRVLYEAPAQGFALLALLLLLVLPQLGGAVAYGTLYFRAESPTQRYRIALISASLVAWFGLALVAAALGINREAGWLVFQRALALAAALAIALAYAPPRWARRRIAEARTGSPRGTALAQRVRELV